MYNLESRSLNPLRFFRSLRTIDLQSEDSGIVSIGDRPDEEVTSSPQQGTQNSVRSMYTFEYQPQLYLNIGAVWPIYS